MNLNEFKQAIIAFATQVGSDIKSLTNSKLDTVNLLSEINAQVGNTDWQTQKTLEQLQDVIGAMFQSGTQTNITVDYDDVSGTLNLTGATGGGATLTDEQVQDIVGAFSTSGTGINVTYDDVNDSISFALSGKSFTSAYETKLIGIQAEAQVNTITGIKGDAESTFRVGQVTIGMTNIDAGTINPLTTYTTSRDS